jgi:exosome complex component CSL4
MAQEDCHECHLHLQNDSSSPTRDIHHWGGYLLQNHQKKKNYSSLSVFSKHNYPGRLAGRRMEVVNSSEFVIPGDVIGRCDDYECGIGCYAFDNKIISTLYGEIIIDNKNINVISSKSLHSNDIVIEIGDIVIARVTKLTVNQVIVEILSVGDRILRLSSRGIIRKEDIRLTEQEALVIHECYRPGDIVKAIVISLGDAKQYFLSTAESEFGVRWAKSDKSGQPLIPLSWKVSLLSFHTPPSLFHRFVVLRKCKIQSLKLKNFVKLRSRINQKVDSTKRGMRERKIAALLVHKS